MTWPTRSSRSRASGPSGSAPATRTPTSTRTSPGRPSGIYDRAAQDYPSKSPEVRQLVDAFAAGWDAYLAKVGVDGINGWCKGADWVQPVTGLDVYAYARSIALQASSGQLLSYIAAAQPPAPQAAGTAYTPRLDHGTPSPPPRPPSS